MATLRLLGKFKRNIRHGKGSIGGAHNHRIGFPKHKHKNGK